MKLESNEYTKPGKIPTYLNNKTWQIIYNKTTIHHANSCKKSPNQFKVSVGKNCDLKSEHPNAINNLLCEFVIFHFILNFLFTLNSILRTENPHITSIFQFSCIPSSTIVKNYQKVTRDHVSHPKKIRKKIIWKWLFHFCLMSKRIMTMEKLRKSYHKILSEVSNK